MSELRVLGCGCEYRWVPVESLFDGNWERFVSERLCAEHQVVKMSRR